MSRLLTEPGRRRYVPFTFRLTLLNTVLASNLIRSPYGNVNALLTGPCGQEGVLYRSAKTTTAHGHTACRCKCVYGYRRKVTVEYEPITITAKGTDKSVSESGSLVAESTAVPT